MNLARLTVLATAALVIASIGGVALVDGATARPASATPDESVSKDPSATIHHEGETLTLETEANQTVTGSTTLDPGSTLVVTLRGTNSEEPFLRRKEVTVDDAGNFSATYDLSMLRADSASPATVTVRADGETLTSLDVTLEPGPGTEPDESFTTAEDSDRKDDRTPAFAANIVSVNEGETAAVSVTVPDGGPALLVVGNDETGQRLELLVEDRTGDGTVTVLIETGTSGSVERTVDSRDDGDRVAVPIESAPEGEISFGANDYPLALYDGQTTNSEEVDVGTLVVDGPGNDGDPRGTTGTNDAGSSGDNSGAVDSDDGPGSDGGMPASPSTLGLTAIAVVALAIAGTITLLRR